MWVRRVFSSLIEHERGSGGFLRSTDEKSGAPVQNSTEIRSCSGFQSRDRGQPNAPARTDSGMADRHSAPRGAASRSAPAYHFETDLGNIWPKCLKLIFGICSRHVLNTGDLRSDFEAIKRIIQGERERIARKQGMRNSENQLA